MTTKPELLEQVVQTNLMGTIWGCQVMAKVMMRQRREPSNTGCIINVSSLLGVKGGVGSTAYAASKAGVLGAELETSCGIETRTDQLQVLLGRWRQSLGNPTFASMPLFQAT